MAQHFTVNRKRAKVSQRPLQFGVDEVPGAKHAKGDKLLEADVQKAVLALLKQHPRVAWAHRFNSRVLDVPDRKSKTGFRPMRMAFKGCADILGMLTNGKALAVECKSTTGDATDDQIAFLSLVNKFGGCAFIARKADDVLRYIPLKENPDE
jgi:hypothetical protein